jgi:hypothetical protein
VRDAGGSRLLEGLELLVPDAALLQFQEPALDEGVAVGVAVAATAVADAMLRGRAQNARAVRAVPLSGDETAVAEPVR